MTAKNGYKKAIKDFLIFWQNKKNVRGAFLVGSYAAGLETSRSDIDICIILKDNVGHWRRGNTIVLGFLIEYALYSEPYFEMLQRQDLLEGKRLRTRMIATGHIIFDKDGSLKQFQKKARRLLARKMPRLNKEQVELRKYYLWDQLDNLKDLAEREVPGFEYAYFAALQEIIAFYAAFLRIEIPRPARIHRFITDEDFRSRYDINEIPDTVFTGLFEKAMHGPSLKMIEQITEHVYEKTGGFSINGWYLQGDVQKK